MKRVRTSIAAIAASALLAISGAEAALDRAVSIDETDPSRAPLSAADAPIPATPLDVLVRVAEAGDVEAMNLLGVLYTLGVEVTRDYSKALYWYQKAIDGGSTNAMNNAAKLYLHGIGVPRDYANAAALFKRSAMGGSVQGMYNFAAMADKGMGISRDPRLAHEMYRGAAQAGYAPAMIRVSDDHARGHGARRDLVEAYAWLEVALRMGLPEELQIPTLSRIDDLAARLQPKRREEARLRAAHLAAVVRMRGRTNPGAAENVIAVSGSDHTGILAAGHAIGTFVLVGAFGGRDALNAAAMNG